MAAAPLALPEEKDGSLNPFHHDQPKTVTIVTVSTNAAAGAFTPMVASATGTLITTSSTVITVPKDGFWSTLEAWFKKLFGSTAKWEQIASSTLTLTAPLVVALADIFGGPAVGTTVGAILAAVQTDMATAGTLIAQASATPTLDGALAAIQTNLQALLQEAKITNPESVQDATTLVNLIVAEIESIQKELPSSAQPLSAAA